MTANQLPITDHRSPITEHSLPIRLRPGAPGTDYRSPITAADRRRLFVLLGTARSGTTWLANIINSHPRVVYSHEAFGRMRGLDCEFAIEQVKNLSRLGAEERERLVSAWAAADPACCRPPFFRQEFRKTPPALVWLAWLAVHWTGRGHGLFRRWFSPDESNDFDVLVKQVSLAAHAESLVRALDPSLVVIVRHPCAVVASELRGHRSGALAKPDRTMWLAWHGHDAERLGFSRATVAAMDPLEFLALDWLVENEAYQRVTEWHPKSTIVLYEDLCRDPLGITEQVFQLLDLEMTRQTKKFIAASTSGRFRLAKLFQSSGDYYSVYKDPARVAEAWKAHLTPQQIERVWSITGTLARWYWPNVAQASSLRRTEKGRTEKAVGNLLPERPDGCCVQETPDFCFGSAEPKNNGRAGSRAAASAREPQSCRAASTDNGKALASPVADWPLIAVRATPTRSVQPVTVGIPFPRGQLAAGQRLELIDHFGRCVPVQTKPLAYWSDGSVKWLLVNWLLKTPSFPRTEQASREASAPGSCFDSIHPGANADRLAEIQNQSASEGEASEPPQGRALPASFPLAPASGERGRGEGNGLAVFHFTLGPAPAGRMYDGPRVQLREGRGEVLINTEVAEFHVDRKFFGPFKRVVVGPDVTAVAASETVLTDAQGQTQRARIDEMHVEAAGPLHVTLFIAGRFSGSGLRFRSRLCFFAGTGLVRVRFTIHNPRRAVHRGGLWDLGDPGSILFRDLSIALSLPRYSRTSREPDAQARNVSGIPSLARRACVDGGRPQNSIIWRAQPGGPWHSHDAASFEIYQDSSGGENWESKNHVNREGRVPCSFRGYRVQVSGEKGDGSHLPEGPRGCSAQMTPVPFFAGQRANPQVSLRGPACTVTAAIPEFWQQFPKAIEAADDQLVVRLFPKQFGDEFELQGGEQKTHTVWLNFAASSPHAPREVSPLPCIPESVLEACSQAEIPSFSRDTVVHECLGEGPLDWVHEPACVHAAREWYAASGAIAPIAASSPLVTNADLPYETHQPEAPARDNHHETYEPEASARDDTRIPPLARRAFVADVSAAPPTHFESLMAEVIDGPNNFFARREVIDEFGWRNFGEIYADHEAAFYTGPKPVISHYNNQYDFLFGTLLQFWRTGDRRWFELADPLARHVIDIDIYHTDRDRLVYNGGLFWFTDHYKDAGTATHRTFSRANRPAGRPYGGGPGAEHNFTTGLLHYYYLTGDVQAAEAVEGLADWVVARDDGSRTALGLIDDSPTGLASGSPDAADHRPARAGALSIEALLDGWLLTGRRQFLKRAEDIIRRCIHPDDDVAARELDDAERHWSYTLFLAALARYLAIKAELDEFDAAYAYARASLLRYADWMLVYERPALEHPERLEYPTETWAAHEFRKANVLRHAASHSARPRRDEFIRRAEAIVEQAWEDLMQFESRSVARSVAIMMVEGTIDETFRRGGVGTMPEPRQPADPGPIQPFVPQRQKVRAKLRTARGLARTLAAVANPLNWPRVARRSSW